MHQRDGRFIRQRHIHVLKALVDKVERNAHLVTIEHPVTVDVGKLPDLCQFLLRQLRVEEDWADFIAG